jgi:twitching motility two-component system response regulator PilH
MAVFLVVDDIAVERANNTAILKKNGHTVLEATNGDMAFAMAKEHKPAAIIMDIVMPIKDGFSAAKMLMRDPETKHIPVIMVSTKAQDSDKFRATQLGAKGYLVKPATEATLMEALKGLI